MGQLNKNIKNLNRCKDVFAEGNVYAITSVLNVTSKYCKVMKEAIKVGTENHPPMFQETLWHLNYILPPSDWGRWTYLLSQAPSAHTGQSCTSWFQESWPDPQGLGVGVRVILSALVCLDCHLLTTPTTTVKEPTDMAEAAKLSIAPRPRSWKSSLHRSTAPQPRASSSSL